MMNYYLGRISLKRKRFKSRKANEHNHRLVILTCFNPKHVLVISANHPFCMVETLTTYLNPPNQSQYSDFRTPDAQK
jgi:hypothetical protein